ncbi:MAG: phosphate ABC transporter permease subunit PstC [Chloroflexi bacterium]|nr:phosphate ABC transporter permease subunit PstC [Chloroflexota bacterium]
MDFPLSLRSLRFFPSQTGRGAARRKMDRLASWLFLGLALLPLILVALAAAALAWRARPLLETAPLWELLSGVEWKPLRGRFGFLPFIAGAFWVTALAMLLAAPPSLLSAIYLAEYARPATRSLARPVLDLLAAIPSVVYGVWGVAVIVPWVQRSAAPFLSARLGFMPLFRADNPTGFSVLAGGLVLAVMVAPFIVAISSEVLRAIPAGVREASLALGATRWQTVRRVALPYAQTGILAGVVLGASRALGETMAVMMVVGNTAILPRSIFDPAYPLPALIANNYGEMLSIPLYDSALMGAALILLVIVTAFNLLSTLALRRLLKSKFIR